VSEQSTVVTTMLSPSLLSAPVPARCPAFAMGVAGMQAWRREEPRQVRQLLTYGGAFPEMTLKPSTAYPYNVQCMDVRSVSNRSAEVGDLIK
jgi:hypothetical protein